MDNTQQRPTFIFLIIGTAWLFDAMDVGLLSFIMPMSISNGHYLIHKPA
ncbi:MFS transporter [Lactobacillus helveticus]|nr:MFS transporter [Lactobacillus helveticus]TLQ19485.1 MFS transporter [Lactobacillus helveticus]